MGSSNQYLMTLRLDGRYEDLIKYASEELERNPSDALVWEMLSEALLRTNKLESAERSSLSCLKIHPENQLAICYLITVYLRLRDFPKCYNAINLSFSSLDEAHKSFLVHEFTMAMDAGVVDLIELPANIRKYAEGIIRVLRKDANIKLDPTSAFLNFLKQGNLLGAVKVLSSINSLFSLDTMINLIQRNELQIFENFLALGLPKLDQKERERLEEEIFNSKSPDFDQISNLYRLSDTDNFSVNSDFELVLRELSRFCLLYESNHDRSILRTEKERTISFAVGCMEAQTRAFDEILPEILGLVKWVERFNGFETRDLCDLANKNSKRHDEVVVLTSRETDSKGSCLKANSDTNLDSEYYAWNIKQIWNLTIMSQQEFLELLGATAIQGKQSVVAFNFLPESVLDSKLQFKAENYGIVDRLKRSSPKARDFAVRMGFRQS